MEFAKRELKKKLMNSPQGDILLYGDPFVQPYDQFTGIPIFNGHTNTSVDVPPIQWEVQTVHHTKEAGKAYKSRLEVAFYVDTEKMKVTNSRLVDNSDVTVPEDDEKQGAIRVPELLNVP